MTSAGSPWCRAPALAILAWLLLEPGEYGQPGDHVPGALENSGLPEALADEVARWSVTSGVTGDVETTGQARALHPEVEVTLLRVAQEALANVAKHAGASRAGVTLSYMEDVVSLDVRDDGAGFAVAPAGESKANGHLGGETPAAGGFGLIAMRQRVSRLAGQLEIESEPGAGTAVSATPTWCPRSRPARPATC